MSDYWVWLSVGAFIVAVLAVIAGRLMWRLQRQTRAENMGLQRAQQEAMFTEMAAALAHIPTHQDWKRLSAEQRAKYGAEMALLEGKYSEQLRAAAQALVN